MSRGFLVSGIGVSTNCVPESLQMYYYARISFSD
jgi:hypothetical protein